MHHTMLNSKCYRGLTALFEDLGAEVGKQAPFEGKWCVFRNVDSRLYVMVCHSNGEVRFAPLYIHRFPFLRPHFLAEAEKVNIGSDSPKKFETIADKLRYYRHRRGLLQREVADYMGIKRTTYSAYEEDGRDYYPFDVLERLAGLYGVGISYLIDEYNAFLCNGQAQQVRALRDKMKMTQAEFVNHFGISKGQIKKWETGKARMGKKFWKRIFNDDDCIKRTPMPRNGESREISTQGGNVKCIRAQ